MKIGTTANIQAFYGDDAYSVIKRIGFDCVDFGLGSGYFGPNCAFNSGNGEIIDMLSVKKGLIDNAGLTVSQTHAPFVWEVRSATEFKNLVYATKQSLLHTKLFDCKYMVVHPIRYGYFLSDEFKDKYELNKVFLSEILNEAEKQGVFVALENFPMDVGDSIEEHLNLFSLVKSDKLVACFDTGHAFFAKNDLYDHVVALGSKLKILHIHDNYGTDDHHNLIFYGNINWKRFCDGLKKISFDGVFSLENGLKSKEKEAALSELMLAYQNAKYLIDNYIASQRN